MMKKIKNNLIGKRFGKRVVLAQAPHKKGRVRWRVLCDCGYECEVLTQSLKRTNGCVWCSHKGDRPYRRLRPFEAQYNNFKKRARFKVKITYEQFAHLAEQKECHYCNAEVIWSEWRTQHSRGGAGSILDRKDYKQGYSIENVAVCCARCNYAKGTHFSYSEWKEIGSLVKGWGKRCVQPVTPLALLQKEIELENGIIDKDKQHEEGERHEDI